MSGALESCVRPNLFASALASRQPNLNFIVGRDRSHRRTNRESNYELMLVVQR
jgi:hypothetical protein